MIQSSQYEDNKVNPRQNKGSGKEEKAKVG